MVCHGCKGCKEKLFAVYTDRYVAGIIVKKLIIKTAPILKWAIGLTLSQFDKKMKNIKGYKLVRTEDQKIAKEIE